MAFVVEASLIRGSRLLSRLFEMEVCFSFLPQAGKELSQTVVNPMEALEVLTREKNKTAFLVTISTSKC